MHLLVFDTWMKFALLHGIKHTKLSTTFFCIFTPLMHFLLLFYPFNTYPHPSQLWPFLHQKWVTLSVLVAKWSKARVCGRSLSWNTGSNLARGMDDSLLWMSWVVTQMSLWWGDPWSSGVLPNVLCQWVWSRNLKNEAALARVGLLRQEGIKLHVHPSDSPFTNTKLPPVKIRKNYILQWKPCGNSALHIDIKPSPIWHAVKIIIKIFIVSDLVSSDNTVWWRIQKWRQGDYEPLRRTNFISTPKSHNALKLTTFFITYSISFHNVPKLLESFPE